MDRLEHEFVQAGKAGHFARLKGFIIGQHSGTTYREAAEQMQVTEGAVKLAASRMRRRYRELLRDEIAQTVATPDEVDVEIRMLFAILEM